VFSRFGLSRAPFTAELPPEALFPSTRLREALARLRYVVEQRALGLLLGEPGAGKSAALRAFVDQADPATHKFIYLANVTSVRSFYRLLCHALGLVPAHFAADLAQQVQTACVRLLDHGVTPVILCDETQDWPTAVLQEIRLLRNTEMDARSPAAVVLVGHGSLRRHLALEPLRPLAQRIAVTVTLGGLSGTEIAEYVDHQLRWAGAERPLFTHEVIELLAHYSRGLPRQINRLATAALLAADAVGQPLVEEPAFRAALKETELESA